MTLPDTARDTERNEIALQFADIRPYYGASIIVADPPWEHVDWSKRGNKAKTPGHQYQTQSSPMAWAGGFGPAMNRSSLRRRAGRA